mgnify:FL=1
MLQKGRYREVRNIQVSEITERVREMCIRANHFLSEDMDRIMKQAEANEESPR